MAQAVILSAGRSSRFYPLNNFAHKSLAPLLGKPIFIHALESVKRAGITDVVIVTGKENEFEKVIGDGSSLGLNITYVIQAEPLGMGDALLQAEDLVQDDFFLLHPHHVEFDICARLLSEKKQHPSDIVLLSQEEEVVEKYGVLKIEKDKVVEIVEKPKPGEEPSKLRVIGIYLLNRLFLEELTNVQQEHYNFEKAITEYAKEKNVQYAIAEQPISSLKYPWDLLQINKYLLDNSEHNISETAQIATSSTITGNVIVEKGVKILEGVVIKGPCYIGENTVIGNNAILRDYVSIGDNCVIGAGMEMKNSIMFKNSTTHSGFLGSSIVGENTKIAGFFGSANVRIDRKTVKVKSETGEIDSGLKQLGVVIGNNVRVGIRVSTMPGVIIGNNVTIGPSTTVLKNVADNLSYYTKFHEIVEKMGDDSVANDAFSAKDKLVLFDIDYTLFNTGEFKESNLRNYKIYEEVIESLIAVGKIARLGIFSEGQLDFQKTKLLRTDIYSHFLDENIHIVQSKDETIREILKGYENENIYLVDDKLTVLHTAKNISNAVRTIWVKRGIYAENQKDIEGFVPDAIVEDLRDIATKISDM